MENQLTCSMLSLEKLVKQYDGVRAVDNVSFSINKGDIYGFLGPNGAGKTTTIRMIMGIIRPDSGIIKLNGQNINSFERRNLGYLPEDRGLYQKQKLSETIHYFGLLRGLAKEDSKRKTSLWLDRFNLKDQRNRKIEELSKGNQQKIQFILAFLHDPELLILDEPFTGLDPLNQLLLKEIIQEKSEEGKTIVFSTHQMEQVERLCSNICLINRGQIIIEGKLEDIRKANQTNAVEVLFSGSLKDKDIKSHLNNYDIKENSVSGFLNEKPSDFLDWINKKVEVKSFQLQVPSLEKIFIDQVRKTS
ncbi:ATP-binding cassette domain-containing protein [Candidatus Marinimicrobia bacterium]|nr:ATP-binding cassette domain-containing protein [Candidatus Neomarinimicrobiota bacterium]